MIPQIIHFVIVTGRTGMFSNASLMGVCLIGSLAYFSARER